MPGPLQDQTPTFFPRPTVKRKKQLFPLQGSLVVEEFLSSVEPELLRQLQGIFYAGMPQRETYTHWWVWELELCLCGTSISTAKGMETWLRDYSDQYLAICHNYLVALQGGPYQTAWADVALLYMESFQVLEGDTTWTRGGPYDPLILTLQLDPDPALHYRAWWNFLTQRGNSGRVARIPRIQALKKRSMPDLCSGGSVKLGQMAMTDETGFVALIATGQSVEGYNGSRIQIVDWRDTRIPVGLRLQSKAAWLMDVDPDKGTVRWKEDLVDRIPRSERGPRRPGCEVVVTRLQSAVGKNYYFDVPKIIWAYVAGEVPAKISLADGLRSRPYAIDNLIGYGWVEDHAESEEVMREKSARAKLARTVLPSMPMPIKIIRQRSTRKKLPTLTVTLEEFYVSEKDNLASSLAGEVRAGRRTIEGAYNFAYSFCKNNAASKKAYKNYYNRAYAKGDVRAASTREWARRETQDIMTRAGFAKAQWYPFELQALEAERAKAPSLEMSAEDEAALREQRGVPVPQELLLKAPGASEALRGSLSRAGLPTYGPTLADGAAGAQDLGEGIPVEAADVHRWLEAEERQGTPISDFLKSQESLVSQEPQAQTPLQQEELPARQGRMCHFRALTAEKWVWIFANNVSPFQKSWNKLTIKEKNRCLDIQEQFDGDRWVPEKLAEEGLDAEYVQYPFKDKEYPKELPSYEVVKEAVGDWWSVRSG